MGIVDFVVNNAAKMVKVKKKLNSDPCFSKIATVQDVDMKGNEWDIAILLKGEKDPVHVFLNYEFKLGKKITVSNIKADRIWLNALLPALENQYPKINREIKGIELRGNLAGEKSMKENGEESKIATNVSLNMNANEIKVEVLLKGETSPLSLSAKYFLEGRAVSITNVTANKEWASALADMFKDEYSKINLDKSGMLPDLLKRLF